MSYKFSGWAFPSTPDADSSGMTLRDYFAAKAMAGDFAAQTLGSGEIKNDISDRWLHDRAKLFYRMADAMVDAR